MLNNKVSKCGTRYQKHVIKINNSEIYNTIIMPSYNV